MKGGSGRKKSETNQNHHQEVEVEVEVEEDQNPPSPPPPVDVDGEDKEMYEGVEEDEEDGEADDDYENDEQRPKLDEGFYEIEDVRKKRTQKGQIQYLIKWRGWPETANTWEPKDNLQSCSDIIKAFERRSSKSSKKRKRKQGNSQTPKKKQQRVLSTSTTNQSDDNSLSHSNLNSYHIGEAGIGAERTDHPNKDIDGGHRGPGDVDTVHHLAENGFSNSYVDTDQMIETNEVDPNLTVLRGSPADYLDDARFSVLVPDSEKDGVADEQSKSENTPTLHGCPFTGAKRRKSGRVKRFKQDLTSNGLNVARHPEAKTTCQPVNRSLAPDVPGDDTRGEVNLENSVNPLSLIKIIHPVTYSTSISNNVHDVSITFKAMRSDGREITVDNKYLKANHPLLLIDFYEKHLRYTPPM